MEIVVVRQVGAKHKAWVTRPDGSSLFVPVPDYGDRLPHDLVHFAVESAVPLAWGFWGLVEAGATFDALAAATARDPRSLAPRRDPLVAEHLDELIEAEVLVDAFSGWLGPEPLAGPHALAGALDEAASRTGRPLPGGLDEPGRRDAVAAEVAALDDRWRAVGVGGRLTLSWASGR